MSIKGPGLPVFDLIMSIADLVDLVSPVIENHHKQTAYIAYCIGEELGLPERELFRLYTAGSLHDMGAFSLESKLKVLDFEVLNAHQHAYTGYLLLKDFAPLTDIGRIIRYHHVPWMDGEGREWNGAAVPELSHIVHLADRIAVLIDRDAEVLQQVRGIVARISEKSGSLLMPEAVDAFRKLAEKESFWLDVVSKSLGLVTRRLVKARIYEFEGVSIYGVAEALRRIIDFRSRFTAVHSSGVAAVAGFLASFSFLDMNSINLIKVAGLLHDIGKLIVPSEVLEKTGSLSRADVLLLRKHTYYSFRALEHIESIREINSWISFHHERLDGKGYPFRLRADQIPLGARIIAVADYFTAITEERPYRKGISLDEALKLMRNMSQSGAFDPDLVSLLVDNIDDINALRSIAQAGSAAEYRKFRAMVDEGQD